MFRAIRDWQANRKLRRWAGLFLFEFVVVMVGVLAAQGLQNWANQRSAASRMEEARARTLRELSDNLAYAQAWTSAIPCLDQRMQEVMRRASAGSLDPGLSNRPRLAPFILSAMDDESELLMRSRYGNRHVDQIKVMQANLLMASDTLTSIVESWGRLSLADPQLGSVSDADRGQARLAAADIRAQLRGMNFLLGHTLGLSRAANVRIHSDDRFRPATSCDEVWRTGEIAIPA
jgi:hypothetical protein